MALIPTVRIHKDGASLIINEGDLAKWQADGWSTDASRPAFTKPLITDPESEPDGPAPDPTPASVKDESRKGSAKKALPPSN